MQDAETEQISLSSGSEEENDNIKDKQVKKVNIFLVKLLYTVITIIIISTEF